MRITILALGSRGDVLPYAALGKGLQTAGHRVRLATFENFASLAAGHGLEFHPVRGNAQAIMQTAGGQALAESGLNPLRSWLGIMRSFGTLAAGYARDLTPLLDKPTDAIINQLPAGLYGHELADRLGVPMLLAAVIPLARTRAWPMVGFPTALAAVPGYNALTYRLAEQLAWQGFRRVINRWRREVLELPPAPLLGYHGRPAGQATPVLCGFSGHVVPRPADWGEHIHVTGYWLPEDESWRPTEALLRFLDAGPPPLFVGFGSMPVRQPERLTGVVLAALRLTGQRAVLHAGWGGLGERDLPENVFKIKYAAYEWLFPRMAALVHHGGSGTTAFGLRAGTPALVAPFVFDQFFWGERLFRLGVGARPLPYRQLTAERLAAAIEGMLGDGAMHRRAAVLGSQLREEDGIGAAVRAFHQYVTGVVRW